MSKRLFNFPKMVKMNFNILFYRRYYDIIPITMRTQSYIIFNINIIIFKGNIKHA